MFKVITMSDSNYFRAGKVFLETRNRVKADFVLYGPDLNVKQIDVLNKHNINYIKVDENLYKTQMQFLKFGLVKEQLEDDSDEKYRGFTFADFDTFFINDWSHIFDYDFDYGITVRNDMVKQKRLWAYTNGGVTFAKHTAYKLITFAEELILKGKNDDLIEYDQVWRTLETGRPEHKTHYRTVLRWWVDQVFFSSLVLRYFKQHGYHKIGLQPKFFKYLDYKIGMFSCNHYNVLNSKPVVTNERNIYIRHLKSVGREVLGVAAIKEKL